MAASQPKEFVMTTNVGGIDRVLRIVVGIAVLALFFVLEGNARYWARWWVSCRSSPGCSAPARSTRSSGSIPAR